MRQVINPQLQFGEQDIGAIVLDPKSRDDIPQLLRGLQYIYTNPELRARVFAILEEVVPAGVNGQADTSTGRPGMEQWKILVLGVLRLGLNADYDRIQELANEHKTIRQMLGHSDWAEGEEDRYQLQTIKDNLRLFTPEILDRINQEVVRAGHALVKKSPEAPLHVRADSFVVETDVHYPTDLNLLWDALRTLIRLIAGLCEQFGILGWRQSAYQLRQLKTLYRQVQRLKHSTSQDPEKRAAKQEAVRAAHRAYLEAAEALLARVRETRVHLDRLRGPGGRPRGDRSLSRRCRAPDRPDPPPRPVGADHPPWREAVLDLPAPHRVDRQGQGRRAGGAGAARGGGGGPAWLHPHPSGDGEEHRRSGRRRAHRTGPGALPRHRQRQLR